MCRATSVVQGVSKLSPGLHKPTVTFSIEGSVLEEEGKNSSVPGSGYAVFIYATGLG